jgi:hypothetical protein
MFSAAVRQIFVDWRRVKGARGSESESKEGGLEIVGERGASGVQQSRLPMPESEGGEILGAGFIGVSLEQQSSLEMGSFGGGEVLDGEGRGMSVEQ